MVARYWMIGLVAAAEENEDKAGMGKERKFRLAGIQMAEVQAVKAWERSR
jgi:hypothetical protein